MSATEVISLVALILVSGGVTTILFELLKRWIPDNDALRSLCAWAIAIVLALATSWLAGDVLGLIGKWRDGSLSAGELFLYGNSIAAAATVLYNTYYKGIKPLVEAGKATVATLTMRMTGANAQRLATALTDSTSALKEDTTSDKL